jgi:hypothetical protein
MQARSQLARPLSCPRSVPVYCEIRRLLLPCFLVNHPAQLGGYIEMAAGVFGTFLSRMHMVC